MKEYREPKMRLVNFRSSDVVCASDPTKTDQTNSDNAQGNLPNTGGTTTQAVQNGVVQP